MSDETNRDLVEIKAPWGKEIKLQEIAYEGGLNMVRLRMREGRRFTDLELDPDTAHRLGSVLVSWAEGNRE